MKPSEPKSERRARRYYFRFQKSRRQCEALLWLRRSRCARWLRLGPNALRGKSYMQLVKISVRTPDDVLANPTAWE